MSHLGATSEPGSADMGAVKLEAVMEKIHRSRKVGAYYYYDVDLNGV